MNNMTPVTGRCLAVIPARAGSRQLPGKNLKLVGRMSLVERAIDVAIHSDGVNLVVVSSDDPDVLALAEARKVVGLPRPPALAGDSVSTLQVAGHVASLFPDADPFVLLQPTSPLRTTA
ncbi:MAG: acylneuraminate cytidylyltransferase family protein, partial [Acidimicrobiia bacterium]|nr:acylneuraminate cytidylyltransferase family protein [Acidimicrobiia bacterium]